MDVAKNLLFRSFIRIFAVEREDTFTRGENNQASLILFRSFIRIFVPII